MSYKKLAYAVTLVAVVGSVSLSTSTLARGLEGEHTELSDTQKRHVAEKKAELKSKIDAVKTERTEKLATKKLEMCEKRQERVNQLIAKATERNTKHLAVFQKIENKVKAFYVKKNVTVAGYELAVENADAKEAAAIAAIDTSSEVTFDCATADGAKPGADIKAAMKARHTALKEYRTAIRDLILVVKQHNGQNREKPAEIKTENESETQSTGMEQ